MIAARDRRAAEAEGVGGEAAASSLVEDEEAARQRRIREGGGGGRPAWREGRASTRRSARRGGAQGVSKKERQRLIEEKRAKKQSHRTAKRGRNRPTPSPTARRTGRTRCCISRARGACIAVYVKAVLRARSAPTARPSPASLEPLRGQQRRRGAKIGQSERTVMPKNGGLQPLRRLVARSLLGDTSRSLSEALGEVGGLVVAEKDPSLPEQATSSRRWRGSTSTIRRSGCRR